ncbi:hypothetical protein [Roseateles sp.]|uniref:hypothetical protein n=1 Tax=Roseateles sp. TaxID=1971397 RepID=UPI002F3F0A57
MQNAQIDDEKSTFQLIDELSEALEKFHKEAGDTQFGLNEQAASRGLPPLINSYHELMNEGNTEEALKRALNYAYQANALASSTSHNLRLSEAIRATARNLQAFSQKVIEAINNDPAALAPLNAGESINRVVVPGIPAKLQQAIDELLQNGKKEMAESRLALQELNDSLSRVRIDAQILREGLEAESIRINTDYETAVRDINNKRKDIDKLLGHVAGRVIVGGYEESATNEKDVADWFRRASLACMAAIFLILTYSLWESTQGEFNWQKSVFRIIVAFLLSAPAAYLARESAKHRTQQYMHHQTSLDLKAISPYIASLPDEVQHKIKGEFAGKLFSREIGNHAENFPINSQELLIEIIKKLEFPRASAKPSADS